MSAPYTLHCGDCLDVLKTLPDNSVDAVVCDPPYGLSDHRPEDVIDCLRAWLAGEPYMTKKKGFMGKTWDSWVPGPEVWRECLRVLKPGGHLLAFAGTRTMDMMCMAVRLAGFEMRDSIGYANDGGGAPLMAWAFGSGFPKSKDVSKAIDMAAGAERRVIGVAANFSRDGAARKTDGSHGKPHQHQGGHGFGDRWATPVTEPNTSLALQWQGWGTALKPAWEPIILARKPLIGNVAQNVLAHSTGALNIDGCRIGTEVGGRPKREVSDMREGVEYGGNALAGRVDGSLRSSKAVGLTDQGRWPANLILSIPEDEYALRDDVTPDQLRHLAEWMDANP